MRLSHISRTMCIKDERNGPRATPGPATASLTEQVRRNAAGERGTHE